MAAKDAKGWVLMTLQDLSEIRDSSVMGFHENLKNTIYKAIELK